jgi:hypothetical protein
MDPLNILNSRLEDNRMMMAGFQPLKMQKDFSFNPVAAQLMAQRKPSLLNIDKPKLLPR